MVVMALINVTEINGQYSSVRGRTYAVSDLLSAVLVTTVGKPLTKAVEETWRSGKSWRLWGVNICTWLGYWQ